MLLPNRAETLVVLMAVFQAGWNFVPLNSNLTAAEVSYILGDAGAKALVVDEQFGAVAAAAAAEAGVPEPGRLSVGTVPGFTALDVAARRTACWAAGATGGRAVHAIHLGYHRASEGGATLAPVVRP